MCHCTGPINIQTNSGNFVTMMFLSALSHIKKVSFILLGGFVAIPGVKIFAIIRRVQ